MTQPALSAGRVAYEAHARAQHPSTEPQWNTLSQAALLGIEDTAQEVVSSQHRLASRAALGQKAP